MLGTYVPGDTQCRTATCGRCPDHSFRYSRARDLRNRAWHTYAVEITKRHISWFVDTQVMRTETPPARRSGREVPPPVRDGGRRTGTMRPSWMQVDWVRYYTLKRHNAKSIAAPQMDRTTYDAPAC